MSALFTALLPRLRFTLSVGGAGEAGLARAAAITLSKGGAAFNQTTSQAADSAREGIIIGSAGGPNSASGFDMCMRLLGHGRLAIKVASRRTPPEVNAEPAVVNDLHGRILQALKETTPRQSPGSSNSLKGTPP